MKTLKMSSKTLTIREQAAIQLQILSEPQRISPSALYKFAYPGSLADVEALNNLAPVATHWWQSKKVQEYYQEQRAAHLDRKAKEKAAWEDEVRREMGGGITRESGLKDYSLPANQRAKLNELVNTAADPGEALDALKVMISSQKDDRQAAQERKQAQLYLPLSCEQCPLYLNAKSNI